MTENKDIEAKDILSKFKITKKLGYATIYRHKSRNIVMVKYSNSSVIDIANAVEISKNSQLAADLNRPVFALTVPGQFSEMTSEAREFFGKDHFNQIVIQATAIIIKDLTHRITFNLYLKFNKPISPIIAFKSIPEAYNWLIDKGAK
ncbi:MAG: hypothetical protein KDB74_13130 [Flavobacteriales bacterium]|nr:hypothetical protein [Flavobacteriales bacterium]